MNKKNNDLIAAYKKDIESELNKNPVNELVANLIERIPEYQEVKEEVNVLYKYGGFSSLNDEKLSKEEYLKYCTLEFTLKLIKNKGKV